MAHTFDLQHDATGSFEHSVDALISALYSEPGRGPDNTTVWVDDTGLRVVVAIEDLTFGHALQSVRGAVNLAGERFSGLYLDLKPHQ